MQGPTIKSNQKQGKTIKNKQMQGTTGKAATRNKQMQRETYENK